MIEGNYCETTYENLNELNAILLMMNESVMQRKKKHNSEMNDVIFVTDFSFCVNLSFRF